MSALTTKKRLTRNGRTRRNVEKRQTKTRKRRQVQQGMNGESSVSHKLVRVNKSLTWISYVLSVESVKSNTVALVIPGNPGPIGFYDEFISTIFKESFGKLSIYGISHAGHHSSDSDLLIESEYNVGYRNRDSHLYSLEEQISHKVSFIQTYLTPDTKIILIGHSIGSYILLEIMKRLSYSKRVLKGILLFPTIERITRTPQYRVMSPVCHYLRWPMLGVAAIFSSLPTKLKRKCIELCANFRGFSRTRNVVTAILSFLNYRSLSNMLKIGRDMGMIDNLHHENFIEENAEKLIFYYGAEDPWVPRTFYEEMKDRFPTADINICTRQIKHAFVLYSAEEMGKLVWSWINPIFSSEPNIELPGRNSGSVSVDPSLHKVRDIFQDGPERPEIV